MPAFCVTREIDSGGLAPPLGTTAGRVTVDDVGTAAVVAERDITLWKGGSEFQWSPDGHWLFFAADRDKLSYSDPNDARKSPEAVTVPTALDFLVLPEAA